MFASAINLLTCACAADKETIIAHTLYKDHLLHHTKAH